MRRTERSVRHTLSETILPIQHDTCYTLGRVGTLKGIALKRVARLKGQRSNRDRIAL